MRSRPCRPRHFLAAALVGVVGVIGGTPTAAHADTATISGTVLAPDGTPAPSICVFAFDAATDTYAGFAASAADGSYSLTVTEPAYKLAFSDCSGRGYLAEYFDDKATLADADPVAAGSSDLVTQLSAQPPISGTVTNAAGEGLGSVCVYSFDAKTNAYQSMAVTDAGGAYTVPVPGSPLHKLLFTDCAARGYVAEYYDGATSLAGATAVASGTTGLGTVLAHALDHARQAVADRQRDAFDIAVIGDSVAAGNGVTARRQRWLDVVRSTLAGGGWTGLGYEPATPSGGVWPYTPLWTSVDSTDNSVYGLGRRALVLDQVTSTATLTVTADELWLFYTATPGGGVLHVAVDGVEQAAIDTGAPAVTGGQSWTTGRLTLGTHTLTVTPEAVDGSVAPVVVDGAMVFAGDTTAGPRQWEAAHGGYAASHFVDPSATWPSSLAVADPDLVVIELGINDMYLGSTIPQFKANLRTIVAKVRAAAPGVSIALMPMWKTTFVYDTRWKPFVTAQYQLATELGLGVIDLYTAAKGLKMTGPNGITSDGVHPNVKGNQLIADLVLAALQP